MSAAGFICVGGPLDGSWRAQPQGVTRFHVAALPDPGCVVGYGQGPMPDQRTVKHLNYVLQEHPVHGAAWVFQQ